MDHDRELDLVIYGATGFAGRRLAEHVARHAPDGLRVGLGGRSPAVLESVRAGLPGIAAASWPLVVADALDETAVAAMAARTRVLATTVGPYAKYGKVVVAACAAAGTHYADITGEVLYVRRTVLAHDEAARATGARIVTSCGFDSIPSDLGVWSLHRHAADTDSGTLTRVTGLFTGGAGGFSGGTVDSLRNQVDEAAHDRAARRVVADPHALDVGTEGVDRPGPPDRWDVRWDADLQRWLTPFVMAPFNSRVVRRSNALLGGAYGPTFRYREVIGVRGRVAGALPAAAIAASTQALVPAMAWGPSRRMLDRMLPAPGSGPSEETLRQGYFRMRVVGETTSGRVLQARVGADLDPGYGATAVMLGESALALVAGEGSTRAGVLTPAVALGDALVDRLRARGFEWEVAG